MTVQVPEISSFPSAEGMTALCSVTRTGSRSSFLPEGAFSQVMRDPSGSQPRFYSLSAKSRLMPSFTRAMTCPPASRIAVIRSWPGKLTIEAGDAAGEQVRAAADQPFQQGLLPGPGLTR